MPQLYKSTFHMELFFAKKYPIYFKQYLRNNKTAICNNAEAYGLNTALFKGLL